MSLGKRDCGVGTGAAWCGQGAEHTWPRGCAHVAKRVYIHGQEGVYTWLAGLVRQVYSGPSQPVVRTFSVMIIS